MLSLVPDSASECKVSSDHGLESEQVGLFTILVEARRSVSGGERESSCLIRLPRSFNKGGGGASIHHPGLSGGNST
jgi:hypothetical protein